MPSKIRPDDWDRLFAPNASRRGGPLRALLNIVLVVVLIVVLSVGVRYVLALRDQQRTLAIATATAYAPTAAAVRSATAQTELHATQTLVAALTGTAAARQVTPTPAGILTAKVANGGNVRAAPVNGARIDTVNAGETVQLLQKNQDGTWFKITYGRGGQTITGWISKTLLTIDPAVEQQVP